MNCNEAHRRFLEMDNRARPPLTLQIHTLFCTRCRRDLALLAERFASLRGEGPFGMDRDLCDDIMREVFRAGPYEHHVGAIPWAGAGLVILVSMFLIPFSNTFAWLRHHFGRGIEMPVSIVLGIALTIYALTAVFSNLDDLKKFVANLPRKLN